MALIFQFCNICGARYGTRSYRSKHCSNACRQAAYRKLHQQTIIKESIMTTKETQQLQASAEELKAFVLKNVGRMTPQQMAEATSVSLYLITRLLPNPAR